MARHLTVPIVGSALITCSNYVVWPSQSDIYLSALLLLFSQQVCLLVVNELQYITRPIQRDCLHLISLINLQFLPLS